MGFKDKTITCSDCGSNFVFSADEQEHFLTRGFTEPKRCPACRAERKGSPSSSGGGSHGQRREMFPAVCAQCGKDTEVPFKPSGDRPVYCNDCFRATSPRR